MMIKVYLAGGFKSGWQRNVVTHHKVIDPSLKDETGWSMEQIGAWDKKAIQESNVVFAYMERTNPSGFGLSCEIGFAHALGKTVILPRDRTPIEMDALRNVASDASHLKCQTERHSLLGLRDWLIWNLFESTGMRIHEIAGLKISDVDPQLRIIHVLGKGGKKAPVQMSQRLMEVIASWLDRMPDSVEGNLVTDWNGHGLSTGQIRIRIQMMGERAGVQDLKPHDLRHTYAYELIDQLRAQGDADAVALDGVRKQLRHGDARTTQKYYLHVRDSHLRAAVEAM
jgi:integrase